MVDGVEYDGLDAGVAGPRLGPKYDHTVHYFPFAPRVSSLFAESAATPGMALTCLFALGLILLAAIPRKGAKGKKSRARSVQQTQSRETRKTMAELMENTQDYDDTLEEYYQNGWDENDPSWQCACGKWNTGNYCESCGKPQAR